MNINPNNFENETDIDLDFGKFEEQDVSSIVNVSLREIDNSSHLSYTDDDLTKRISFDMEVFTELQKEYLEKDTQTIEDVKELAKFRWIKYETIKDKGIFYSDNIINSMARFPSLRKSSISSITNSSFEGRYMLPIKLISGEVFTYLGYNPYPQAYETKYEIPNLKWINQSNLIGNLDSINLYNGNNIYVTEGYFDALCINSQWNKKSICIFGNRISKKQQSILYLLKQKGHKLIFVPDNDEAGERTVTYKVWDNIWKIPSTSSRLPKDVNQYILAYLLDQYPEYKDREDITIEFFKDNIPFHKESTDFDFLKFI